MIQSLVTSQLSKVNGFSKELVTTTEGNSSGEETWFSRFHYYHTSDLNIRYIILPVEHLLKKQKTFIGSGKQGNTCLRMVNELIKPPSAAVNAPKTQTRKKRTEELPSVMQTKIMGNNWWRKLFKFKTCYLTVAWLLLKLNPSTTLCVFNIFSLFFLKFSTIKNFPLKQHWKLNIFSATTLFL